MALNFPSSPTNGQLYTSTTGVTYQYNGTYWNAINTSYATGGFRKIDNISSQFNGSNTTFYLNVSGIPTTAVNPQNLIISVGGITQEPGNAYTVSANTITFTTAPSSGMSFFGTLLGDVANIGIPSDKTVGLSTLTDSFGSFVTSSYAQANTATTQAQSAYDQANTGTTQAQASFLQANNAYTTANTKFNSSGGTITGPVEIASSLIVTGNVTMSGNVTTINANNLSLQDNMFYLNSGSNVANPDLGFAGNYNDGAYRHAGFFRDATDGYWKVFDSYLPEPDASPYIDTSNSSFKLATFQANNIFVANNVGIGTTSPLMKLHIYSTTAQNDTYGFVQVENTSAANTVNAGYTTKNWSGTSQFMQWEHNGLRIGSRILANYGQGNIYFTTGSDYVKATLYNTGGHFSAAGNLHTNRGRLAFSSTATDPNHCIYNNYLNLDSEGSWDGIKMNVYAGLNVRIGNASGATPTTALLVDGSGRVTTPQKPRFESYRSGNLTNYTGGTAIIYNNATVNVGSHYNASTGLFTAPVAGNYIIQAGIYMSAAIIQIWPLINGNRSQSFFMDNSGTGTNLTGTTIVYLNANDTFGVTAYAGHAPGLTVYENSFHTYFRGHLIS